MRPLSEMTDEELVRAAEPQSVEEALRSVPTADLRAIVDLAHGYVRSDPGGQEEDLLRLSGLALKILRNRVGSMAELHRREQIRVAAGLPPRPARGEEGRAP